MTDIVERLRERGGRVGEYDVGLNILMQAADEIERLHETCVVQGETIDRLHEEIERLTDALKTCRDLRVYESREIVRLRKLYE